MRIVTGEDLEAALDKPFSEFTPAEKELIGQRYSVVSSTSNQAFDAAQELKLRARKDVVESVFRIVFVLVLLVQLDNDLDWNWWLVFSSIWFVIFVVCFDIYQSFAEVQRMAMEKDPNLFAPSQTKETATTTTTAGDHEAGKTTTYGAVCKSGEVTPLDAAGTASTLTDEEREQLRAHAVYSNPGIVSLTCNAIFKPSAFARYLSAAKCLTRLYVKLSVFFRWGKVFEPTIRTTVMVGTIITSTWWRRSGKIKA
jgi:hypothetical protein